MSSLWLRPAIDDEIKNLRNELFTKRRESFARLGDGLHIMSIADCSLIR